jgi:hypothetical protein
MAAHAPRYLVYPAPGPLAQMGPIAAWNAKFWGED